MACPSVRWWLRAVAGATVALLLAVAARGALAESHPKPAAAATGATAAPQTSEALFYSVPGADGVPFRTRRSLYQETQSIDGGNFLVKLWARQG